MKKNLGLSALLYAFVLSSYAQQNAEDNKETEQLKEVEVVSDSKFELNSKTSGKVVTKITNDVIEKSKGLSVSEVLNKYSGIQINESTSNAGNVQGVSVRGGRSGQVLVRIDGVTVNDPSALSSEFDFRLLNLEQIESIEVLKGGASTLFGSGASAGVINIKLKESAKKILAANFNFSFGTNQNAEEDNTSLNDTRVSAGLNGSYKKVSYLFSVNHQVTNGLSAAEPLSDNEIFENDPFEKTGLYAKLNYKINDDFNWGVYGNFDEIDSSFDNFDQTDGENSFRSRQRRVGNIIALKFYEGIEFNYSDGFAWSDRVFSNTFETDSFNYTFDAFFTKKFELGLKVAAGVNGSFSNTESFFLEQQSIDADFNIVDPYVNVVYNSDFGFNLNLGGRLNIHSDYDNEFLYSINPSYNIQLKDAYLQLLSSYSTAYITPSLFDLNDPFSGNPDLEPEESATLEGGFKYERNSKISLSAVYFHRNQENALGFDPLTFVSTNAEDDFETQGVEVEFRGRFLTNDALNVSLNYTYTDLKDVPNSSRIAKDVVNANIGYDITKSTNILASYQYRGDRNDSNFTTTILEEYNLLDFQVNQKVLENFDLFARVSNILNEDYQEAFGFETKGINYKLGLNFNF